MHKIKENILLKPVHYDPTAIKLDLSYQPLALMLLLIQIRDGINRL